MDFDRYAYHAKPGYEEYEFYSEGPKGRIRKVVLFEMTDMLGFECHNLSFGDWNDELNKIQYNIKSNNGDTETLHVYGDTGKNREPFQRDSHYLGFLIRREEFSTLQEPGETYISFVKKIKHMEKATQENEKRPAVIFLHPPTSEEHAQKRQLLIDRIERIGLPEEVKERMRIHQRKLFMIHKHPPANEEEAREREAYRRELEAKNLPEEWLRRFRKFHGIEE